MHASQEAVDAYERSWGPLTVNHVNANNWNWLEGPWPWEGGMD